MSSPQPSPARKYVYENAIHRIEVDQMLADFEDQAEVDRVSRERRSALQAQVESLRARGGHLFGPDDARRFPPYIRELHANNGQQPPPNCGNPPQAQADHQVAETPCAADAAPTPHRLSRRKTKGKNIAARMMRVVSKNSEALYWTLREWADDLRCSTGTIGGLPYWKCLMDMRARLSRERVERADQTAYRPRGGRSCNPRNQ